jgi:transposase
VYPQLSDIVHHLERFSSCYRAIDLRMLSFAEPRSYGMEAYPNKMRELVLDCYDEGLGTTEIATRFKVSCDWVRRVRRRWLRDDIRTATKQKHGPNPLMDTIRREQLARLVDQTPDATLEELKKQLLFPVSISTVHRTLNEMKLSLKKSRRTPANRNDRT